MKKNHRVSWLTGMLLAAGFYLWAPLYADTAKAPARTTAQFEAEKNQWLLERNYQAKLLKNKRDFVYQLRALLQRKLEQAAKWQASLQPEISKIASQRAKLVQEKKNFRRQHKLFEAGIKRRKFELGLQRRILGAQFREVALGQAVNDANQVRLKEGWLRFDHMRQNFHKRKKTPPTVISSSARNTAQEMQMRFTVLEENLLDQAGKLQNDHEAVRQTLDERNRPTEFKNNWKLPPVDGAKVLMAAPAVVTTGDSDHKNYPSLFRGKASAS